MKNLTILLIMFVSASADEIAGNVYDLFTREALSDVKISLGSTAVYSSDDGDYQVNWQPKESLQVETKGYAPFLLPTPQPGKLDIVMLPGTDEPSKPYRNLFNRIIDTAGLFDLHERGEAIWRCWQAYPIPVKVILPGEDQKAQNVREAAISAMGEWDMALGQRLFQPLENGKELQDFGITICWGTPALMENATHPRIEYKVGDGWRNSLPPNSPRIMARITILDHQGYYDPKNALLWALGRILLGGSGDPKEWNPRDPKSILRAPLSSFEAMGNLTATVKSISQDDATAIHYLLNIPDGTNLSHYYYLDPAKERRRITESFHGFFGMGIGGGYFAHDHWQSVWHQKTGEKGSTSVIFPARLIAGISWWRLGLSGDVIGASPIGYQDVRYISGKPNRAHYTALYCARGDFSVSVSPWREFIDLSPHGGVAYLAFEVGGFPKYVAEEGAESTRNSANTYGATLSIKPFGPRYDVAQGFCIPIPPDLTMDYTLFQGLKNSSILTVKLGSLIYPSRASGFPPTELHIFLEQYRNSGSWANMFGFEFATYILK